jgi:hypothetical protein
MTTKKEKTVLHNVNTDFIAEHGGLTMKNTQHIDQKWLDRLKDVRNNSGKQREKEFMRVASIPNAVVDQWLRDGFNIYEESGKEIVKRLRAQNLDYFMTTEKKAFN